MEHELKTTVGDELHHLCADYAKREGVRLVDWIRGACVDRLVRLERLDGPEAIQRRQELLSRDGQQRGVV